jgi:hypothetical protein
MAQLPTWFEMRLPGTGVKYRYRVAAGLTGESKAVIEGEGTVVSEDAARQIFAGLVKAAVAPEAALEDLDDPEQVIRLAAEHLARRRGVEAAGVRRCFDRVILETCGGRLTPGTVLIPLFTSGPLSWPRRAFECDRIEDPLGFLSGEDLARLPTRMSVAEALDDPRIPLFAPRELGAIMAEFVAQQDAAGDGLLRDGHAPSAFARSPWLDVWLNKLYPVKIPFDPSASKVASLGDAYDARYVEGRRLSAPLTWQQELRRASRESALLEGQVLDPCPPARPVWGRWRGRVVLGCDYAEADFVPFLHEDDREWLESIRPVLHRVRILTLKELGAALRRGGAAKVWDRVQAVLADHLEAGQVGRLLRIDRKYLGYDALHHPAEAKEPPCVPGGLSTVIELAGFVEKELAIGTLRRTREELGGLVGLDALGRPRLVVAGHREPYLALAAGAEGARWRAALDLYDELESKEVPFWADIRCRLERALAGEIPQAVAIPVKPGHREMIQPLLENQVRTVTREIRDGLLSPHALLPGGRPRPVKRFPPLEGLRWQDVTMTFLSGDSVEISAQGTRATFMFSDMDFVDGRRKDRPDMNWVLLQEMAAQGGELDWSKTISAKLRNNASAKISKIRDRLKAVLGIDDDPFEPYRRAKGYKPKFKLVSRACSEDRTSHADE